MKVVCLQDPVPVPPDEDMVFSLFHPPQNKGVGRVAASMLKDVRRAGAQPSPRAWDFLAIALSVAAADFGCLRKHSPDGWTRDIQLKVAVSEPNFWETQAMAFETALRFLTTDIWRLSFVSGGVSPLPKSRRTRRQLDGDCVCLLSGGVDSLVGAIDAVSTGQRPVLVSQVVRGDKARQRKIASMVAEDLSHLQLTHAIRPPGKSEPSQRARSMVFLAYGVLAASALPQHRRGEAVTLIVPENGFISLNVPFTPFRIGSLSTRTTHPFFIRQIQNILEASGLHVKLSNGYQVRTKGEMLLECTNQDLLGQLAFETNSCGRYTRFNYHHCGRCVPCLVRRAAFLRAGMEDETKYVYENLSLPDSDHRDFDDVRSAAFAAQQVARTGVDLWAGAALNYLQLGDITPFVELAERGVAELRTFLNEVGAI